MSQAAVPRLATANTGPLLALEQKIVDEMPAIERWFRLQWQDHTPPFYGSVDLRNAGYKLAPVDMNLFPGGFNNLSEDMLPSAVQAAQSAIEHLCPDARNLVLIPERHTRNLFYLANVARLAADPAPDRTRSAYRDSLRRGQGTDAHRTAERRHLDGRASGAPG